MQMQICISNILSHNNLIYTYIINKYKIKDNIISLFTNMGRGRERRERERERKRERERERKRKRR